MSDVLNKLKSWSGISIVISIFIATKYYSLWSNEESQIIDSLCDVDYNYSEITGYNLIIYANIFLFY